MRHNEQSSSPVTALEVSEGGAAYASLRPVIHSIAIAALAKATSLMPRARCALRAGCITAVRQDHHRADTRMCRLH